MTRSIHRLAPAFIAGAIAFAAMLALLLARGDGITSPALSTGSVPATAEGEARIAASFLQKVTLTGDPRFYAKAEAAVKRALALDPRSGVALTEAAALAASRHDFTRAEAYARQAAAAAPELVSSSAVLVDALVQQARIDDAAAMLQSLLDRKPSSGAYARASYLRQLQSDLPSARSAMLLAISASGDATRQAALLQDHLAEVEILSGRPGAARHAYRTALARFPDLTGPQIGLAQLDAADGHLGRAVRRLEKVLAAGPNVDASIVLGEVHLAAGREAAAHGAFAAVEPMRRRLAAAGAQTDGEFAEFEADHGTPSRAVAMARRAHAAREGIHTADALAWALTRAGRAAQALPLAREAIGVDPTDPHTRYHAGLAARAAGHPELAKRWLRMALARPEILGPYHEMRARRALQAIG